MVWGPETSRSGSPVPVQVEDLASGRLDDDAPCCDTACQWGRIAIAIELGASSRGIRGQRRRDWRGARPRSYV